MNFKMTVNMDNQAFEDNQGQLNEIIETALCVLRVGNKSGICFDSNGNRVGQWEVK